MLPVRHRFRTLCESPAAAAIHFRLGVRCSSHRKIFLAEKAPGERGSFPEIGCACNTALARPMQTLNVPSAARDRGGRLVATFRGKFVLDRSVFCLGSNWEVMGFRFVRPNDT